MRNVNFKKLLRPRIRENVMIFAALVILIYLCISFYFVNHFFFNTRINGVKVSLKAHWQVEKIVKNYVQGYKLKLVTKSGEKEELTGQEIELKSNDTKGIMKICQKQISFTWGISLFQPQDFYIEGLYSYGAEKLEEKINQLNCLNKNITEPQNVSFKYENGTYTAVKEVVGNKIDREKLNQSVEEAILKGVSEVNLEQKHCYITPRYTIHSNKMREALGILNKYVSTKVVYKIRGMYEVLDGNTINQWLGVDENLAVFINEKEVKHYIYALCRQYDTVGVARNFKTSLSKIIEVKGGFYGWKINQVTETKALMEHIKNGDTIGKEPVFVQKAVSNGENEIGNTYVEINITRQHLWFYKDGELVVHGAVVTGNVNRGFSTQVGTYMLNYKQEGATLRGHNYEADVTYWMPFNGGVGIHDAKWRHAFGGVIYKERGTHGCVNVPLYLAKAIYENIDEGTPIVCYEEE